MQIFVTILEETVDAAVEAIRALRPDHDGIEVRAERFAGADLTPLRAATPKPVIVTHRGMAVDRETIVRGVEWGFEYVDVEWPPRFELPHRDRIVLSHHDYEAVPDIEPLVREMQAVGCAHVKVAATPRSFAENDSLLWDRLRLSGQTGVPVPQQITTGHRLTLIGMGDRGLYSRILAPFLGSALMFVAPNESKSAVPGQLTLERALAIYGDRRTYTNPAVFAVIGNPVAHSLSPAIHNPLFREHGLNAVYTAAHLDSFDEILGAKGIKGLSITAPFKEDAFRYARQHDAELAPNAVACGAVNTLLFDDGKIYADNTDVDGFTAILHEICGKDRKSVAIVGAGGTARAALAAVQREQMHVTVFNRTANKLNARPLEELQHFDGEIVINTLPAGIEIDLPLKPTSTLIEAAYGNRKSEIGNRSFSAYGGEALLHAQARRQNELFRRIVK